MSEPALDKQDILSLERPESSLLYYYAFQSMFLGPLFFVLLIPLYLRYRTLRYRFDEEGVSMRWGILFHREINLTYARIQDIHLVSNAVERWLGLARIKIQTASGSAKAEMTIEGIEQFQALRNFLYGKMRGAREGTDPTVGTARSPTDSGTTLDPGTASELTATLRSVAEELRSLRRLLEEQRAPSEEAGDA